MLLDIPLVSWVKNLSINHYASDLACFFQWFGQFLQSIFQTKFKNEHSIARQWHSVRVMTRHFCLTMVELPKPYLIYFSGFFPALFANISKVLYPFFFHFSSSIFTPPLVSHLSSPLPFLFSLPCPFCALQFFLFLWLAWFLWKLWPFR